MNMTNQNDIRDFDYLNILRSTQPAKPLISPELVKELKGLAQKHPINIAVNSVRGNPSFLCHLDQLAFFEIPQSLEPDTVNLPTIKILKKRDDSGNGKFTLNWGNMKIGFE